MILLKVETRCICGSVFFHDQFGKKEKKKGLKRSMAVAWTMTYAAFAVEL
jgi:hypothetical protein